MRSQLSISTDSVRCFMHINFSRSELTVEVSMPECGSWIMNVMPTFFCLEIQVQVLSCVYLKVLHSHVTIIVELAILWRGLGSCEQCWLQVHHCFCWIGGGSWLETEIWWSSFKAVLFSLLGWLCPSRYFSNVTWGYYYFGNDCSLLVIGVMEV
jgi:hypothetical protein